MISQVFESMLIPYCIIYNYNKYSAGGTERRHEPFHKTLWYSNSGPFTLTILILNVYIQTFKADTSPLIQSDLHLFNLYN